MLNAPLATATSPTSWNSDGRSRVVRFVVTGAGATVLNILLLWLLCGCLGMPYLPASVLSFSTALTCNFAVQKIWTFGASGVAGVHVQWAQFVAANLFNLSLNTAILYMLVERLAVSYLVAQIMSSALISANSYCAYRRIFQDAQMRFRL
jgi:putative flippase GtrA